MLENLVPLLLAFIAGFIFAVTLAIWAFHKPTVIRAFLGAAVRSYAAKKPFAPIQVSIPGAPLQQVALDLTSVAAVFEGDLGRTQGELEFAFAGSANLDDDDDDDDDLTPAPSAMTGAP